MPQFSADQAAVASVMQQVASVPAQPDASAPPPEAPAASQELAEPEVKLDYREFDERHKEAFRGLLYVGHLTEDFTLFGHDFSIATPTQTERLQVGPIIKEFRDTITNEIAYQAAIVALYLVSIDGQPLPQPILTNAKENVLRDRFRWVTDNLRRPVINAVCDRCMILEDEVDMTLDAMGKAQA